MSPSQADPADRTAPVAPASMSPDDPAAIARRRALGRALFAAIEASDGEKVAELVAEGAPLDPWLPGGESAFQRAWALDWSSRDEARSAQRAAIAAQLYRHPNDRGHIGEPELLRLAIERDRPDVILALASEGVDLEKRRPWGRAMKTRPIDEAARLGKSAAISALASARVNIDADEAVNAEQAQADRGSPLALAIAGGRHEAAQTLLALGASPLGSSVHPPDRAPLCLAAARGDAELLNQLLGNGVSPDPAIGGQWGAPPEAYALMFVGMDPAAGATQVDACVTMLLHADADLGFRDLSGRSALHAAAEADRPLALRALALHASLELLEARDDRGQTAADLARDWCRSEGTEDAIAVVEGRAHALREAEELAQAARAAQDRTQDALAAGALHRQRAAPGRSARI